MPQKFSRGKSDGAVKLKKIQSIPPPAALSAFAPIIAVL